MLDELSSDGMPRFQGESFDQMMETFSKVVGPLKGVPLGAVPAFSWKTKIASDRTTTLFRSRYTADWHLTPLAETPETMNIVVPSSGAFEIGMGKRVIWGNPGSAIIASNKQTDHFAMRGEGHSNTTLSIDWGVVTRTLSGQMDRPPLSGSLDFVPEIDLSSPAGLTLASLVQTLAFGMSGDAPLLHSPIAMARLTEGLVALILETVPHRYSEALCRKPPGILPRHVKRAIDFMHANMARPLSSPEIAAACGVSVRSLEGGFRCFKNTTPMAYLRNIRLEAVHAELSAPNNSSAIAAIAWRWGFAHLGRFSALYRAVYGELPSETAARRRD